MPNLTNAIAILDLQHQRYTLDDVKQVYRKLAMKHHPDKGGSNETMQLINTSYEELLQYFTTSTTLIVDDTTTTTTSLGFIDEIAHMQGVVIEVCGYWIWLTGNTKDYKDQIKSLGFKYSGAKKSWYWSPTIDTTTKKHYNQK